MSFGTKYGKRTASFAITIDSNPTYRKLSELLQENGPDTVYPVYALFITEGRYGEQALAVIDSHTMVNLPAHTVNTVKDMLDDPEAIGQMNTGTAGFKIYEYTSKNGRTGQSVTWVDRTPGKNDPLPF